MCVFGCEKCVCMYPSTHVCKTVCLRVCDCAQTRVCGADAGVAIDDRAVTTVTLSGIRRCLLNTNQIPPGTSSNQSRLSISPPAYRLPL